MIWVYAIGLVNRLAVNLIMFLRVALCPAQTYRVLLCCIGQPCKPDRLAANLIRLFNSNGIFKMNGPIMKGNKLFRCSKMTDQFLAFNFCGGI